MIQYFVYWTFEYCISKFAFMSISDLYFWPTDLGCFNNELLSIIIVHKVCNRLYAGETGKNSNLLYFFALWNFFNQIAIVMHIFFFNFFYYLGISNV